MTMGRKLVITGGWGEARSTSFRYPEVVHNHFLYRHPVDDHNGKRHSPISLEVIWATKRWPNRVFAFLLSITEVNCYLAKSYFTSRKSNSMLDFWKSLLHQLIENEYFDQEAESQHCRSTRIQEGIVHGLMSVPPYKKFWAVKWCLLTRIHPPPPQSAIFAEERCGPTANALQVSISVVTALQTTSMKQVIHCKQEG